MTRRFTQSLEYESELREVAKRAAYQLPPQDETDELAQQMDWDSFRDQAQPERILALFDEIDRLREQLKRKREECRAWH